MQIVEKILGELVDFLAMPEVRAIATLLSVASVIASLWAIRTTYKVMVQHERDIAARQSQSLDEQWQKINLLILQDASAAAVFGQVLGSKDVDSIRIYSFYLMLANMLSSAYAAKRRGLIEDYLYETQLSSVATFFLNDFDLFQSACRPGEYSREFLDDCSARFKKLTPLSPEQMRETFSTFMSSWSCRMQANVLELKS